MSDGKLASLALVAFAAGLMLVGFVWAVINDWRSL